jgi:hypothetical protein
VPHCGQTFSFATKAPQGSLDTDATERTSATAELLSYSVGS